MSTTPLDIINLALKNAGVLGVGQSAQAEDTNDAFTLLNFMLAQWQRKRWLIWHLTETSFTSTGAQSYTVGPGQQFNIPRPDRIEYAFLRQLVDLPPGQRVDYPLEILESREVYSRIALKQLSSFPSYVFYDSAFPIGFLYPWPLPQANLYAVFIGVKKTLSQFTSLGQNILLPPEYYAAILYNLSWRLIPMYKLPPDPVLQGLARDSLAVIRGANAQIPRLTLPCEILRPGIYNYLSDTYY